MQLFLNKKFKQILTAVFVTLSISSCGPVTPLTIPQVTSLVTVDASSYSGDIIYRGPEMTFLGNNVDGMASLARYGLVANIKKSGSNEYFLLITTSDLEYYRSCYLAGHGILDMEHILGVKFNNHGAVLSRSLLERYKNQGLMIQLSGSRGRLNLSVPSAQVSGFLNALR